ncbi:MAG: N-acetylgalactosamine-6-sulfatase [Verrucomicrobiales bacterium]|nr:N-acetylgalactosamine-6-sulfatase [Verrucomicrobiales bacterium]|tara:strand:+ start:5491 stop:6924 length:1434 start_codon:yes stop_codon:yes gene_type:complete
MKFVRPLVCILTALACLQTQAASKPNIVLIVSDDQGYGDFGILKQRNIITPNLDRLCREGTRLTSFYVSWPACTPSRGSLLTGRYPQRNGVYDMIRNEAPDYGKKYTHAEYQSTFERIGGMDEREILLPKALKTAGYTSAIYGKWDLGTLKRYLPTSRGFDDFYGFVNTGIDYYTHERYGVPSMYRNLQPTEEDKGTYATYLFEREAMRFLNENWERPFFLYLPFNAPHGSSALDPKIRGTIQAPEKYEKMYPPVKNLWRQGTRYGKETTVPSKEKRVRDYMASVTCMDESIGRVLNFLDEKKIADNTMVIFFSDNGGGGGSDNRPLKGGKSRMWEGGIRVCSVMRWPGRIPAGKVNHEFLTSLEIFPTLAKLAKAKVPADLILDGFDLLPVLQGKKKSPRKEMFWERKDLRAARVGNWKWVDTPTYGGLFDLSKDTGEKKDLSEARPDMLRKLKGRFANWKKEMEEAEPRGPFRDY